MCDHFVGILSHVSKLGYNYRQGTLNSGLQAPNVGSQQHRKAMAAGLTSALARSGPSAHSGGCDTWIVPTVQAGSLGVRQEEQVIGSVLEQAGEWGGAVTLTSAYFNPAEG